MPYVSVETNVSPQLVALFSGDGKRIVVVMEAFMDESGTHKGSPTVSVAAVVGAHWQWRRFLSFWDDRYFHAKDPRCAPRKHGLFEAMQDSELKSFVAWIKPEDYRAHATAHFRSGLGNAYAVCAFASAMGVCKFCRDNNLGKIAFVLESGQPNVEFVRQTLEYMQTKERYRIASVAVANKKDFVQLCTADFVAHSRTSDEEWFGFLYDSGRVSQDHITSEKLARMSSQITEAVNRFKRNRRLLRTRDNGGPTLGNDDANAKGTGAKFRAPTPTALEFASP